MDFINLSTLALAIFVICAGFVLLRGVLRIFLGSLVLCAAAYAGFRLWHLAPALTTAWFGKPFPWVSIAIPILGFIATFIFGRLLLKLLSSPFQKSENEPKPLTLSRLLIAALFTLVPTAIVITIAATLIFHIGSLAEIRHAATPSSPTPAPGLLATLKNSIDQSIPPSWLKLLDPMLDPNRIKLAKQIASQSAPPLEIDPKTSKPIPRAIIVDDPALQNLAREGHFNTLLNHPLLTKALNDPKIKALIQELKH